MTSTAGARALQEYRLAMGGVAQGAPLTSDVEAMIKDVLSGFDEDVRVAVLLNAITDLGRPDHDVTPARLVSTFARIQTFDDMGERLNWSEIILIAEAARSIGLSDWADGFQERGKTMYDPEGYKYSGS